MTDADPRRLLFVHAHPDDETIDNGATIAHYVASGAHVTVVTCTLGEEGDIVVPELTHLGAAYEDRLAERREQELKQAMSALGVSDHRFLGGRARYRDSGMMGSPPNSRPDCFWRADPDEADRHLVEIIRHVRPQVIVTYNPDGGYGHPDHIQTHRITMRAAHLAADATYRAGRAEGGTDATAATDLDRPHAVDKIYWNCFPRAAAHRSIETLRAEPSVPFTVPASPDDLHAVADDLPTCVIDASAYVKHKADAMRAHATQLYVSTSGAFFALSDGVGRIISGIEYYRLAYAREASDAVNAPSVGQRETDLFAGLDLTNATCPASAQASARVRHPSQRTSPSPNTSPTAALTAQ